MKVPKTIDQSLYFAQNVSLVMQKEETSFRISSLRRNVRVSFYIRHESFLVRPNRNKTENTGIASRNGKQRTKIPNTKQNLQLQNPRKRPLATVVFRKPPQESSASVSKL